MTRNLENFIVDTLNIEALDEQRVAIANELANIRTFIRDCDVRYKPSLIAKIWFLAIRGENTQWANIEFSTLMAHDRPSYKRIGYLAAMNLCEANAEFSVLITHTLEKDLASSNPLVQMLPLTLLSQIGTAEMFNSLANAITNLVMAPQVYVQKRCVMAMFKAVKEVPELCETFRPYIHKLLSSPHHSVVMATIDLAIELIHNNPELPSQWAQFAQPFTKIVKTLFGMKPIQEFAFGTFNDPFLMIKIMKMLAALGSSSNEIDDLLSTIATTVDVRRNTGRSILFQTIQTINACAKKPALRSLAYNQIGRLFAFKEPNVLYSALSSFSRALYGAGSIDRTSADSVVLQRYKSQVVHCLDHRDPSIRRRALDVVAALVDATNVETLIPEVMEYLHMADTDFRSEIVAKIFQSVQRFAPTPKWNFETVMKLIIDSGNYVGTDVVSSFCRLIGTNEDLTPYAVKQLSKNLADNSSNQTFVQVASFVIGEFTNSPAEFETLINIMSMPQTTIETKGYLLIAIAKLGTRFNKVERATEIVKSYMNSNDLELQQRAGELYRILTSSSYRDALLATCDYEGKSGSTQSQETDLLGLETEDKPAKKEEKKQKDVVADLLGVTSEQTSKQPSNNTPSLDDLLALPVSAQSTPQNTSSSPELDLLSLAPAQPQKETQQTKPKPTITPPQGAVEVVRKPDYVMYFEIQKNAANPNQVAIRSSVYGLREEPLTQFVVQYGLPNGWGIQLQKPSSNVLEPIGGNPIVQVLLLVNRGTVPLQMRTQTSYLFHSQPIKDMGAISPDVFV